MKVVFIINSIYNQRCIKRVDEFIANGYDVEVYGFIRDMQNVTSSTDKFEINIIGQIDASMPFIKRLPLMIKAIKQIQVSPNDNVLYYLFQLDVALAFKCCRFKSQYIYEESDLSQTYIGNKIIRNLLDSLDRYVIKKSLLSVFTSDGFIKYHFPEERPNNIYVVPNRLNKSILNYSIVEQEYRRFPLAIGFVGRARFHSIANFVEVFCRNFPDDIFYFYGDVAVKEKKLFDSLSKYKNCIFCGMFKNPLDLPRIYSSIDLVLSTYDVCYDNVRYAEPNKIYEAIYFETPIIVTKNTFLADKVKDLGIGYIVDPLKEQDIINLVTQIKEKGIQEKKRNCKLIPKEYSINDNKSFFEKLDNLLKC